MLLCRDAKLVAKSTLCVISMLLSPIVTADDVFNKLDQKATSLLQANPDFSGVVSVYSASDNRYEKHYSQGWADKKSSSKLTEDTVMDTGSVSKQFTGAALVHLISNKNLTFDDKLGQILDDLAPHVANITLHQLLTHTSGLTDRHGGDYEPVRLKDVIRFLNEQPLKFAPGSHQYTNMGYSLAAAVIEKVSGKTYEQYLRDAFFTPLEMSHTGYQLPGFSDTEVAQGYDGNETWGQSHKKNWDVDGPFWNLRGNGGILSTAADMAKWLKALHGSSVFNEEQKSVYFGKHVREYPDMESYYGYGWVVESLPGERRVIWHNGSNRIFTTDVRYYPEDDVIVIAMGNQSKQPVWEIAESLFQVMQ